MGGGRGQSMTRCLFQLSRRDREFLPFSLMLRDEIENFFPSVSCFETRSRISSLRSHASRRDREFLSSLSRFNTRPRRMLKKMHFCWGMASLFFSPGIKDTRDFNKDSLKYKYITQFPLLEFGWMRPSTAWVVDEKYDFDQSEAGFHTVIHVLSLTLFPIPFALDYWKRAIHPHRFSDSGWMTVHIWFKLLSIYLKHFCCVLPDHQAWEILLSATINFVATQTKPHDC